jgi:hypothetical protein
MAPLSNPEPKLELIYGTLAFAEKRVLRGNAPNAIYPVLGDRKGILAGRKPSGGRSAISSIMVRNGTYIKIKLATLR